MAVAKRKIGAVQVLDKLSVATALTVVALLEGKGVENVNELRTYLHLAEQHLEEKKVTLAEVVKATKMPFSTASRVAWHLHEKGLLKYESHATDRRKKILVPILI